MISVSAYGEGHWTVGVMLQALSRLDANWTVEVDRSGFGLEDVCSYRGYYDCLAIVPGGPPGTVRSLATLLSGAVGNRYEGWKGGTFWMSEGTPLFIAPEGDTGPMVVGLSWRAGGTRVFVKTQEQTWE